MSQSSEPTLVRLAREFGWRAYAVPVLAVITMWILVDIFFGGPITHSEESHSDSVADSVAPAEANSKKAVQGPDPAKATKLSLPTGELPPGGPYTQRGEGTYRLTGKPGSKVGEGRDKTFTYVVEIENGIDTAPYGGDSAVAEMIDATLNNPKGWSADPAFAFQHVNADQNPEYRVQLTSLDTTHEVCGHELEMETSCFTTDGNRVVLNESRWVRGATTAQGDIGSYRQYLISHEVGHGLGYAAHQPCGENGVLAPVMMQQTLSLNNSELFALDPNEVYRDDNKSCVFNPWPFPFGKQ